MTKKYKWTLKLTLLTTPLLFIAVFSMGGGHGTYFPAMSLFPFGLIGTLWFEKITIPFMVAAILQYPIYGLMVDKILLTAKSKWLIFTIVVTHISLVVLIIWLTNEE